MSESSPAGPNRPPAPRTAVRGPSEIIDHAYQAKSPLRILARLIDRGPWFYATTTIIFVVKNSGQWLVAIFLARLIDSLVTPASVNFTALAALGGTTLLALALNVPVHTWFVVRLSECARSLSNGSASASPAASSSSRCRFTKKRRAVGSKPSSYVTSSRCSS